MAVNSFLYATGLLLFVAPSFVTSAWDPDAGLAQSLTKSQQAHVVASSNQADALQANDGNDSTHWTSRGCMPSGFYLDNELSNVLKDACQNGRCETSSTDKSQINLVTDGVVGAGFHVHGSGGDTHFTITLAARDSLRELTVRGSYQAAVHVFVVDGGSEKEVGTLTTSDNYQTRDINVTLTPATALTFRSSSDFTLHQVGALGSSGCVERLYIDLGAPKQVSVIRVRYWPGGHGLTSQLETSQDGVTWHLLQTLNPSALGALTIKLDNPTTMQYIGVRHTEDESNWATVYVWEIDAYDSSGPYGPEPTPTPNPTSFRTMLGVNGIWGWGTGATSTILGPGQGAALYAPVASYGRNYHNLNWDVLDPDHVPDYDRMAQGHGTEAEPWLNWDTEYQRWVANNVSVHVSVQFSNSDFPVSVWDQPRTAAFNYGQAFARHFGPTNGNGLVHSVEVGNEPWDYPADFYRTILEGMASGFKAGDPNMVVMPGAFQANDPTSTGNYIGTRVTADVMDKIDVINSHHYSWRNHEDGSRHATHPEDPAGSFNEVRSIVRWRNANTPSKPLWMTEWGWDSPGGGQDCTKFPECTTELAASAYAARGLLLHARLGVARSTWFFYGNLDDCDTHVFCRSGLTSSKSASFAKKGSFYTLQHFLELAGDKHFLGVIQEDSDAYVFLLGDLSPQTPTHLVAWRPVDTALDTAERSVTFTCTYQHPAHAWKLSMTSQAGAETTLPTVHGGDQWTMALSPMPTVVELRRGGGIVG